MTVAFFLISFFLGTYPGYTLMFNLIFSYLWIVAVAFTASDFTYSNSALLHTVEAFSFIALYVDYHLTCRMAGLALTVPPQLLLALQRRLRLAPRLPRPLAPDVDGLIDTPTKLSPTFRGSSATKTRYHIKTIMMETPGDEV